MLKNILLVVLSPFLFGIYINNIPVLHNKNKSYSLLFADDLVTFFIDKKQNNQIYRQRNSYTKKLEWWLSKWRMKIQSSKCSYIVFNKRGQKIAEDQLDIKMFNQKLPLKNKKELKNYRLSFAIVLEGYLINCKIFCFTFNFFLKNLNSKLY